MVTLIDSVLRAPVVYLRKLILFQSFIIIKRAVSEVMYFMFCSSLQLDRPIVPKRDL